MILEERMRWNQWDYKKRMRWYESNDNREKDDT